MRHNRRFFKVISIVQVVMSAIFLALGMVDRYAVRFVYTSYLFAPCWIAALVLPAGIMGLILVNKSSPSSNLAVLNDNLHSSITTNWRYPPFVKKDAALKLTDQENTVVAAISSLVIIFCITEVALAVCAAWISDSLFQPPQENQISQVGIVNSQFEY
ncbi:uncharacterized protein [Montipora foliosa]|uniref:uncharacterized protein isoform X2 n=1 Tax=Montipora foliosa TaxID=591990 RepID=UPI0035F1CE99